MDIEFYNKLESLNNFAILDSYAKAQSVIQRHNTPICSISGGSDSDIVLDIIHNVDETNKVIYYWFDTGLEYNATKEHLTYLENKYNIEIKRIKSDKAIPTCVKEYGAPFLSKQVSKNINQLQRHNFKWEDESLEALLKKYPNCKSGLRWWCNDYSCNSAFNRFNISFNKYLKEFLVLNPPDFYISDKCCEYAKEKPAKRVIKDFDADLNIIGVRKAEGGRRASAYKSCFSEHSSGCDDYRPVFWFLENDKRTYEKSFNVIHSDCYIKYGMKRTGCTGCPFSLKLFDELSVIKQYEPNLYKAAVNIFGKSYEYTAKYREFCKKMKAKEKNNPLQYSLFDT